MSRQNLVFLAVTPLFGALGFALGSAIAMWLGLYLHGNCEYFRPFMNRETLAATVGGILCYGCGIVGLAVPWVASALVHRT